MNTLKFLAIKLAEQAAEIANGAEHIADHHTGHGRLFDQCQTELLDDILKLAVLAIVAQKNGLVPTASREHAEQLKLAARRALMCEAFADMLDGKLTGDLAI